MPNPISNSNSIIRNRFFNDSCQKLGGYKLQPKSIIGYFRHEYSSTFESSQYKESTGTFISNVR